MLPLLLNVLLLLSQGIPTLPGQSGTIAGTLKTESGEPASGVRVSALTKPDNPADIASAASLAGIAETDEAGHFRIENIPPGRYYVTAGRVDGPTYYPGTQDITAGKDILVAAGFNIVGIDFVLKDTSIRPIVAGAGGGITIPVEVQAEGGGRYPILFDGKPVLLRLKSPTTSIDMSLASAYSIPVGIVGDYRASIENLPAGFAVKSLTYGAVDLTKDVLKITSKSLNASVSVPVTMATTPVTILGVAGTAVGQIQVLVGTTLVTATPSAKLVVTLAAVPQPVPAAAGVRVAGHYSSPDPRIVYLSGTPGIVYSDDTFEFRDVVPGRHLVAVFASDGVSRAESVVIGNQDVSGLDLPAVAVLPADFKMPIPPSPANGRRAGVISLPAVHGRVLEKATQQPVKEGTIQLSGYRSLSIPIDTDGRFEIPRILPGSYEMEIQIFGHEHTHETLVVGDENVQLELSSLRLY